MVSEEKNQTKDEQKPVDFMVEPLADEELEGVSGGGIFDSTSCDTGTVCNTGTT
jgi:hypothetical protein